MRLSEFEIQAIQQSAHDVFGVDVAVALFGSRVDDVQKGGDIDLYIRTATNNDYAHKTIPRRSGAKNRRAKN